MREKAFIKTLIFHLVTKQEKNQNKNKHFAEKNTLPAAAACLSTGLDFCLFALFPASVILVIIMCIHPPDQGGDNPGEALRQGAGEEEQEDLLAVPPGPPVAPGGGGDPDEQQGDDQDEDSMVRQQDDNFELSCK